MTSMMKHRKIMHMESLRTKMAFLAGIQFWQKMWYIYCP